MRTPRSRRLAVAVGLALLAAVILPHARAGHIPVGPDHQATEKDFDVSHFTTASPNLTNRFLPLAPGTQFTFTGTAAGGGGGAHQVVLAVTAATKMVNGVRTMALWDRDFVDGELVEEKLAFLGQDADGNVWNFGEYPEEHEAGVVSAHMTWLAGIEEATPGILMRANPKPNTSTYEQGRAPAIEVLDLGRVHASDQTTCVPAGCYSGVLVIDEWAPNAQPADGHQFTYHAPGVGLVQVLGRGGEEPETLVLTEHRALTPEESEAANARALELDQRAYSMSPAVWEQTAPAQLRCPVDSPPPSDPNAPKPNCVVVPPSTPAEPAA